MSLNRILAGALVLQIVVLATLVLMPAQASPQPASAAFDHTNCQYPDRWTNPPDGCDNSDPAVPECIKAASTEQGEKDCIAAFVAQHEALEQRTILETPVTSTPDYTSEFGGK